MQLILVHTFSLSTLTFIQFSFIFYSKAYMYTPFLFVLITGSIISVV